MNLNLLKSLLIAFLILSNMSMIQAQETQGKPDQVELMKKFIGSWKGVFGDNSIFACENTAFGNGIVSKSQVTVNENIVESVAQLYGYDSKMDKFVIAELKTSTKVIELCSAWFNTETTGEIVITNPDNAPFRFEFEFKDSKTLIQKAIKDGKIVNELVLKKVEDE